VGAIVFSKIPDTYTTAPVTADDLALVWMNDNIIGRGPMVIASLNSTAPGFPYLHSSIFGAGHHPFSFTMESDTCYVSGMALEGEDRIGVRGLDVIELDGVMASGSQISFVGRNT
jgi:hypothetical protein